MEYNTLQCNAIAQCYVTLHRITGIGMAIGLLFLGQGRASLRRDPLSLGALLLSTSPRFPTRTLGAYMPPSSTHIHIYIYIEQSE